MRISDWSSDVCSSDLARAAGGLAVLVHGRDRRQALADLRLRPSVSQFLRQLAGLRAQHDEVVGRPEARMRQQTLRPPATAHIETRLQGPNLAHRHREEFENTDVFVPLRKDFIGKIGRTAWKERRGQY